MTDAASPRGARSPASGIRAWLTVPNILVALMLLWAAPRLLPHLGALIGVTEGSERRPEFSVTLRDGRVLTQDSLRGKVVVVNVWATWCAPCRVEMPALQQLSDRYADDGVIVLGLSVDRGPTADVDAFLAERDITYPVAIVDDETVRAFGGVRGYPTSMLVDRDGVIRHSVLGPIGPLTLRPAIRRLTGAERDGDAGGVTDDAGFASDTSRGATGAP